MSAKGLAYDRKSLLQPVAAILTILGIILARELGAVNGVGIVKRLSRCVNSGPSPRLYLAQLLCDFFSRI